MRVPIKEVPQTFAPGSCRLGACRTHSRGIVRPARGVPGRTSRPGREGLLARGNDAPMNVLPQFLTHLLLAGLVGADLTSCQTSVTREVSEGWQRSLPLAADGHVVVENPTGAVWIAGWDRAEVQIEAVKRARDRRELEGIAIQVDHTPGRVEVRSVLPRHPGRRAADLPRVDYTMHVPRGASLESVAAGRGAVTVKGIAGSVVASSVNGSVTAEDTGGDLKLHCVNGRVVARVSTLAAGQVIELETVNGSTSVVLPARAAADVVARVVNGDLSCDFPLPVEPDHPAGLKLEGRVGGGGARVTARTVNGLVRVGRQP